MFADSSPAIHRVLFVLSLLLYACGDNKHDSDANTVFTDPAGYRLSVPDGWRVSDHTKSNGLIRADISGGGKMGLQVRLASVSRGRFAATVKSMLDGYRRDMTGHWGGTITETGRCNPNTGEEALIVRFQARRKDEKEWYLQESFVRAGKKLLILQGGCPWPDRKEAAQAFDSIVESVVFTSGPGK